MPDSLFTMDIFLLLLVEHWPTSTITWPFSPVYYNITDHDTWVVKRCHHPRARSKTKTLMFHGEGSFCLLCCQESVRSQRHARIAPDRALCRSINNMLWVDWCLLVYRFVSEGSECSHMCCQTPEHPEANRRMLKWRYSTYIAFCSVWVELHWTQILVRISGNSCFSAFC